MGGGARKERKCGDIPATQESTRQAGGCPARRSRLSLAALGRPVSTQATQATVEGLGSRPGPITSQLRDIVVLVFPRPRSDYFLLRSNSHDVKFQRAQLGSTYRAHGAVQSRPSSAKTRSPHERNPHPQLSGASPACPPPAFCFVPVSSLLSLLPGK